VENVKRAYGLWVSRQLKDEVQGRRAQYLVPVIDMINGEVEKRSNVIVDDAPRSSAGHMELDLKSTRPILAGEQLYHLYDSCSNASFLQWYGFLSDCMAMGSPFHRSGISPTAVITYFQEQVDASTDNAELKVAKRAVLGRLKATGIRVLNIAMSTPLPEDLEKLLRACARVVMGTADDLKDFRDIIKLPANIPGGAVRLIEYLQPKEDKNAQAPLLLKLVDYLISKFIHGASFKEDLAFLTTAHAAQEAKTVTVEERMKVDTIKLRVSERTLFFKLRQAVAKACELTDTPAEFTLPRICDNCGIFHGLKACSHCGNTAYCSRTCQVAKWRDHKRATAKRQQEEADGNKKDEVLAA